MKSCKKALPFSFSKTLTQHIVCIMYIFFTHLQTKGFFGYSQQSTPENAFQIPWQDLLEVVPIACPLPVEKNIIKWKYWGKSVKNKNKKWFEKIDFQREKKNHSKQTFV